MTDAEHIKHSESFMPLCEDVTVLRHRDIFESLKLDLKIAADGYPELGKLSAEDICRNLYGLRGKKGKLMSKVYETAASVYCHELYFKNIVSGEHYPSLPQGKCAELLKKSFGSAGNFFYMVRTIAAGTDKPGFLWLYQKNINRRNPMLGLIRLPLYSLPDLRNLQPLMCIDLWEHAYIDRWHRDISGYADACLRQTDWERIFGEITV